MIQKKTTNTYKKSHLITKLSEYAQKTIVEIVSFGIYKSFSLTKLHSMLAEGASRGASNVLSVLLEPFRIAAMTILYYGFRLRKEGFDLEIMAEELEADIKDDYDV